MNLFSYLLGIAILFVSCKEDNRQNPKFKQYPLDEFCMGVDLSYVPQLENNQAVFMDSGKPADALSIFKDHGANLIRIRLWHTPTWQLAVTGGKMYSDLADVVALMQRAKRLGLGVNLDLHYSDDWADPQKQNTPAAWQSLSLPVLKDSVYQYTKSVLEYLAAKDLYPAMIQIGNETNFGMMWPVGKMNDKVATNFSVLLNAGIKAVRDFSTTAIVKPKILLHVAQLQDAGWWAKSITAAGVNDYDILGVSHYSKWSTVNTMKAVTDTIRMLTNNYRKTVMVVETAYPFTSENADSYQNLFGPTDGVQAYPFTKEGQFQYMKDLTQAIINGGGKGIQYWEPAWISTKTMNDRWGKGSSWDNMTLFDFQSNVLPAMDFMQSIYQF